MTETNIWTSEENVNTIHLPGGETVRVDGPISAATVRDEVRAIGTAKFTVEDVDGNPLPPSKFPVNGDVYVQEYNEVKVE